MSTTRKRTRKQTLKKDRPQWPPKYYRGLSATAAATRRREIKRFGAMNWRNPAAYQGFATDKGVKTKPSSYTKQWYERPNTRLPGGAVAKSLKQKAAVTGVPLKEIQASYDRGLAAWRTGHRPGATQQQWGYARVHSFLLCGKTYKTTDSDLARRAKQRSASARRWWAKTCR
jgi:hypothetical protein